MFYYFLFFIIFFHENYFYFFMFRDVPGCSGMFRHVPCSRFYRRPTERSACIFVSKLKYTITCKPVFLEWLKWYANWKSTLCEWFKKIMERRIILPRIRRFEIAQCQWFVKIMERRIFTQYHTRIQDKEVIWFLWQCQTINNYSYCLSHCLCFFFI